MVDLFVLVNRLDLFDLVLLLSLLMVQLLLYLIDENVKKHLNLIDYQHDEQVTDAKQGRSLVVVEGLDPLKKNNIIKLELISCIQSLNFYHARYEVMDSRVLQSDLWI